LQAVQCLGFQVRVVDHEPLLQRDPVVIDGGEQFVAAVLLILVFDAQVAASVDLVVDEAVGGRREHLGLAS